MKRKKQPVNQLASNLNYNNNNNELIRALKQKQTTLNHMLLFIFVYRITHRNRGREGERERARSKDRSSKRIHPEVKFIRKHNKLLRSVIWLTYLLIVNDLVFLRSLSLFTSLICSCYFCFCERRCADKTKHYLPKTP